MKKSLLLLALAAPSSLTAQSRTLLSPYLASDGSVQGNPVMIGANVSRETGWVAVRAGGAMDARSALGASTGRTAYGSVFGADVDGLLFAGNPTGDGPIPYAVAGVGARSVRTGGGSEAALSYSYGAGLRTPLTPWLSIEGEARYSEPLVAGLVASEVSGGFTVRFGASVRLSGGTASRVHAPAPVPVSLPRAPGSASTSSAARAAVARRALDTADDYVGVPYTWGGNTPEEGFDCSGFVRFVFARQGIELPRVSKDQARSGQPLPLDLGSLEAGDLIAFASKPGGEVDHIGLYAGDGRFIHSSSSGHGVRFDDLRSERGAWYAQHMVAARRVIGVPLYLAGLE